MGVSLKAASRADAVEALRKGINRILTGASLSKRFTAELRLHLNICSILCFLESPCSSCLPSSSHLPHAPLPPLGEARLKLMAVTQCLGYLSAADVVAVQSLCLRSPVSSAQRRGRGGVKQWTDRKGAEKRWMECFNATRGSRKHMKPAPTQPRLDQCRIHKLYWTYWWFVDLRPGQVGSLTGLTGLTEADSAGSFPSLLLAGFNPGASSMPAWFQPPSGSRSNQGSLSAPLSNGGTEGGTQRAEARSKRMLSSAL